MDAVNTFHVAPRWPLLFSLLIHVSGVLFIALDDNSEPSRGDIAPTVELWVDNTATTNEEPTQIPVTKTSPSPQPTKKTMVIPPLAGDIKLPSPPRQKIVPQQTSLPEQHYPTLKPQSSASKPSSGHNAQHIIDDALAGLNQSHSHQSNTGNATSLNRYKANVIRRIRPYITIPPSIKGNPTVQVDVHLTPHMEVITVKLIKLSGNQDYDRAVLNAINEIGQFPPLPADINPLLFRSIILTFRPYE